MPHPLVLVGGGAIALWLLLSGKKHEPAPPAPPAPPVIPVVVKPPPVDPGLLPEAEKKIYASLPDVRTEGQDDGRIAGRLDGAAGVPAAPMPQSKYMSEPRQWMEYQVGFVEGYNNGYSEGLDNKTKTTAVYDAKKVATSLGASDGTKQGTWDGGHGLEFNNTAPNKYTDPSVQDYYRGAYESSYYSAFGNARTKYQSGTGGGGVVGGNARVSRSLRG